jgi:hypothetical protein
MVVTLASHMRQQQQIDVERMVIPLKNQQGEIKAWCLAIPFLRPSDVPKVENASDAYLEGIAALYQQATDHVLKQTRNRTSDYCDGSLSYVRR